MFTGLVEEVGTVRSVTPVGEGARVEIDATTVLGDVEMGASIAVNGCCLTVIEWGDDWWAADAVPETMDRTNLGRLEPGDPVNLERPFWRLLDNADPLTPAFDLLAVNGSDQVPGLKTIALASAAAQHLSYQGRGCSGKS